MAKKTTKPKAKAVYAWVFCPTATDKDKITISKQFEPVIEELKKNITPLPEPQEINHCIDIFCKWNKNFFYIMQKFKTGKGGIVDYFDMGLARLEFYGEGKFNLAYFRYTGQWFTIDQNISTEDAQKSILEDSWFQVF
jgi:hypothetical protein